MNVAELITRAFRSLGIYGREELPTLDEQNDSLEILKGVYRGLIDKGSLGTLQDVAPTTLTYLARPGQRVTPVNHDCLVTLPTMAHDRAVICVVSPMVNEVEEFIFDARSQTWQSIDNLDLTSEAIFGESDPIGLRSYLAVQLADDGYGQAPSAITVQNAAEWRNSITHNWSRPDHVRQPSPDCDYGHISQACLNPDRTRFY